jgi:hypothetical protein
VALHAQLLCLRFPRTIGQLGARGAGEEGEYGAGEKESFR